MLNQQIATGFLTRENHTVEVANNGQEAVDLLANEHRFDVVLMDVQMPILDGIEATRTIREKQPQNDDLPIIGLSAHAMEEDRRRCLDAGMNDYLTKPLRNKTLMATLARAAASSGKPN